MSILLALVALQAPDKRPNILWIVSEDNDHFFLGCYGDRFAKTPCLDRLAAEGILYLNAFANAPVCAPSRSTIITGMYASSLGTEHMRSLYAIPPSVRLFPQYLKEAGYYCTNFNKTDYNIFGWPKETWDAGKDWRARTPGRPFFTVLNNFTSHESSLHHSRVHPEYLAEPLVLPPFHPDTPEIRSNWVEYYRIVTKMDREMGQILDRLREDGLEDDTIVFYYSDHGGILPRSKRFFYDTGLHVPLIVRFGKNFKHLAPGPDGSKLDRLVSFVDLAPTVLGLAGLKVPPHMQGEAFLGPQAAPPREYVFGFRGRMDERYDCSRTVRDKQFRYIRNYMPHRIYGQYLEYLWMMPATASWEKAWREGKCNEVQSAFWMPKPPEELFLDSSDPWEVKNLAGDPKFQDVLARMRGALREHIVKVRDPGFLPEPMMVARAKGTTIRDMAQDELRYPLERILQAAETAARRDVESLAGLDAIAQDPHPCPRYWAATGYAVRGFQARASEQRIAELAKDQDPCVRITAAEALCLVGRTDSGLAALVEALRLKNPLEQLFALNALEALGDAIQPAADSILSALPQGKGDVGKAAERLRSRLSKK